MDTVVKSLALLLERSNISDRNPPRDDNPAPQIRNPNFRRNPPKSGNGIPEIKEISETLGIKENKEVRIHQLNHPYRKTTPMMVRKY
jgi:hypothetical protein